MTHFSLPDRNYGYSYTPCPGTQPCMDPFACKMKVQGTGRMKAQPNVSYVVLGVITEDEQLSPAQDENTARMATVITGLQRMGIPLEDIQTQSYHISPQYDFIEGERIFRGYRIEHLLNVIVREMNKIGEMIDVSVQNGVNLVNSIRFSAEDLPIYYQQALSAAIDDAQLKARTLGRKLNINVSPVPVQIVEKGFEPDVPSPVRFEAAVITPVQPGTIDMTARIEAVFEYTP